MVRNGPTRSKKYNAKGTRKLGLSVDEWVTLQVLVDNWRSANTAIVKSWWSYQDAAIAAVAAPGTYQHAEQVPTVQFYSEPTGALVHSALRPSALLPFAMAHI